MSISSNNNKLLKTMLLLDDPSPIKGSIKNLLLGYEQAQKIVQGVVNEKRKLLSKLSNQHELPVNESIKLQTNLREAVIKRDELAVNICNRLLAE